MKGKVILMFKFTVEAEPLPQSRPRFSKGRCYQPKSIVNFKAAVAQSAKLAPLSVNVICAQVAVTAHIKAKQMVINRFFIIMVGLV